MENEDDELFETTIDETGLETNLDYVVECICKDPPRPPKSIQLISDGDQIDIYELGSVLLQTFFKQLFGDDSNPNMISTNDFQMLAKYMASVWFHIEYRMEETEQMNKYIINISLLK